MDRAVSRIIQSQSSHIISSRLLVFTLQWYLHVLRRNYVLKHVTPGKVKGSIEVTGRRGSRRKKLLDDLREKGDAGN
jgi:hypothetical protein